MEINITDMGITDAAKILENLTTICTCSAEAGNLDPRFYASVFELIGSLAAAIREAAEEGSQEVA